MPARWNKRYGSLGNQRRRRARQRLVLYTRAQATPERTLLVRLGIILGLLTAVVLVFWLDAGSLEDGLDGHVSLADVIYFTMVSITTVGYGDIVPVTTHARLLDAFLVTPVRFIIWFILLGTAYEFVVQRIMEGFRMNRLQQKMHDHVVICGFGRSGQIAAREIAAKEDPEAEIIAIDLVQDRVHLAAEAGFTGLVGDATAEEMLKYACVDRAKAVIVSTGRDDTTILIVLTIRQISLTVRIIASVREDENIKLCRQAGADVIFSPPKLSGYLAADAIETRHRADFLLDILTASGDLDLIERAAKPEEVGRLSHELMPEIVVRVLRHGHPIPPEADGWRIEDGDILLIVEPTQPSERIPADRPTERA